MNKHAPNIFDFSDYREYLKFYQTERQARDQHFSRSKFCRDLGLPNTRSFFVELTRGVRKLSTHYVERFIHAMGLAKDEAQYFRIMVYFNQSNYQRDVELLLGKDLSLKRWRNTAMHDALVKHLCMKPWPRPRKP